MRARFNLASYHFFIGLTKTHPVTGVNSKLPSGRHFLMWDFDDRDVNLLMGELTRVQKKWKLSKIYLLNTGLPGYYHAYCFTAVDYPTALHIIAETDGVDQVFFKIGVMRGYFTLRYTKKRNRDFAKAIIIHSRRPESVNPYEVCSFITYETKKY